MITKTNKNKIQNQILPQRLKISDPSTLFKIELKSAQNNELRILNTMKIRNFQAFKFPKNGKEI